MRNVVLSIIVLTVCGVGVWFLIGSWQGERSCERYATFQPQTTPEATVQLELLMLAEGEYCYDLPIFDDSWRQQGQFTVSDTFVQTAARFSGASETYIDGNRAIVYYPGRGHAGPDFLYRTESGWVIDRTTVRASVIYNAQGTDWYINESADDYLPLVEAVYPRSE